MRRQLGLSIAVLAIGLLVQFLAPIGAVRFVAAAIADPTIQVPTCAAMAAERDGLPAPDPNSHDRSCCTLCGVVLGGVPMPLGPSGEYALLQRTPQRLAWWLAAPTNPISYPSTTAQARAPPVALS